MEGAEAQVVFLAATLFEMTASPLLAGIFLFFGPCPVAHGIFVPQPGMETRPPEWKHGVLTTGPPGKPQDFYFFDLLMFPQFLKTAPGGLDKLLNK